MMKRMRTAALLPILLLGSAVALHAQPLPVAMPADLAAAWRVAADQGLDSVPAEGDARAQAHRLAREIVYGRAPPANAHDPDPDPAPAVDAALAKGHFATLLQSLQPAATDYAVLAAEWQRLRALPAPTATQTAHRQALRASLERWRWLPQTLPSTRLWVDLPFYQLTLHRPDKPPEVHDVIIGKSEHPTDIFTTEVQGVIYDPQWQPPARLVREAVIPAIQAGRGKALGYQLLKNGMPVPLNSIRWRGRTTLPAGYSIRQLPGPRNALGGVKLDMPNPYGIYLHDTPNKDLFARSSRALSNGCVRVKDALGLADKLLGAPPAQPVRRVALAQPVKVFILYMTARATADGIAYAPDVYHLDARLVAALDQRRANRGNAVSTAGDCAS